MSNLCRYVIAACRNGYIIERGDWTCKGILCSLYYKMGWVWDLRLVQGLYLGLIGLAGGGTVEIKNNDSPKDSFKIFGQYNSYCVEV